MAGKVESAVRRDLRSLDAGVRRSGLAESALALARRMDDPEQSDRDAATVARELRSTMAALRAVRPAVQRKDKVDEVAARRAARRGA